MATQTALCVLAHFAKVTLRDERASSVLGVLPVALLPVQVPGQFLRHTVYVR